nr:aldo/keto reductase [Risungbinella massiliensis]
MANHIADKTKLNNGVEMPWLGLGVWKMDSGQEVEASVRDAIEAGYRHIDTAAIYKNEEGVGRAIKDAGIGREELFVTTKVWNDDFGYETTLRAFEESRKKLGLDYLDLYLVHWPVTGKYLETYRALEKLYQDGYVRSIGVSNFHIHHLEDLKQHFETTPVVNQVEYHPRLTQKPLHTYCREHGIQLEAWSPLMQGKILDEPTISAIAEKYGKNPAQIVLRWDLQNEVVTIPKSSRKERIISNADLFDFELTAEEVAQIDALNQDQRVGRDPDTF